MCVETYIPEDKQYKGPQTKQNKTKHRHDQ